MKRVSVGLGEDSHSFNAHTLGGTHDAQSNLTTVGDEDLLEELQARINEKIFPSQFTPLNKVE